MAYRNTRQADALKLVAQKRQSSLAVEGELPGDGLAAYGDDGDDLMLAPARKIVAGEEDAGSVESVFEQARQVAAEAEALLVDAEWAAPEPEPVATEVVAVGAGNPVDEAGERQRSLFSWAEFMAGEPDEPPKRQRRDEAPTLSVLRVGARAGARGRARGSGPVDGRAGGVADGGGVPRARSDMWRASCLPRGCARSGVVPSCPPCLRRDRAMRRAPLAQQGASAGRSRRRRQYRMRCVGTSRCDVGSTASPSPSSV